MKSVLSKLFKKMLWAKEESEQGKTLSRMVVKNKCENVGKENEHLSQDWSQALVRKHFIWRTGYSIPTCGVSYIYAKVRNQSLPKMRLVTSGTTGCMNDVKTNASGLSHILNYYICLEGITSQQCCVIKENACWQSSVSHLWIPRIYLAFKLLIFLLKFSAPW